jgi:mono/diheme cytochrome c family protein
VEGRGVRTSLRWVAAVLALMMVLNGCAKQGHGGAARSPAVRASILSENPASANQGARVYIQNCSSCHQIDGRGVPGAFPPLAGNAFVLGQPARVIAAVKYGMRGTIDVAGERYDATMPDWSQLITDSQIAEVVTYIRSAWHNRAPPVRLSDVTAVAR